MSSRSPASQELKAAGSVLSSAGVLPTMPRLAVWSVMSQADAPLLVVDIARHLARQGWQVPLSSIYAALRHLNEAGLLSCQTLSDGKKRYGPGSHVMRHCVTCEETGEAQWLDDHDVAEEVAEFCARHGFELNDYTLLVQARRVISAPAGRGPVRRLPCRDQGKGKAPLPQGDAIHEDDVSKMFSDSG